MEDNLEMLSKKSAREILTESEINTNLKECFKKCADGRNQLRDCVSSAIDAGLPREKIIEIINEMVTISEQDESSLCAIIAIGQALRYEQNSGNSKSVHMGNESEIENKLRDCFNKCRSAKRELGCCLINALDSGLNKNEILAISDEIVGGFGKDEVSLCAIVAVHQILRYHENIKTKSKNEKKLFKLEDV